MLRLATSLQGALDRRRWLAPAVVGVLATMVLVLRLGEPPRIIFDEVYYVNDARAYLTLGVEDGFAVHPTVGKWLIAGSISLIGDNPVGWRFAGAIAGVLTVLLTYGIARRLTRGRPAGTLLALAAPLLLTMDGLFISQARIAMLDIFLVLFTTLGIWVLLVDHDRRVLAAGDPPRWRPTLRVLAGVCFGLACGVKWSGLLGLGVAGLLTIGWEVAAARDQSLRRWWLQLPRRGLAVLGSLVLVPLVVYTATWVPWLASYENSYTAGTQDCAKAEGATVEDCSFDVADRASGLWRYHRSIMRFHLGLEATHSYRSDPAGWVVLERPVVYWWETCTEDRANGVLVEDEDTGELVAPDPCLVEQGDAGEVLAVGNPAMWWPFLLLLPALIAGAVRRDRSSALPLVAWLGHWLPWLLVSRTAFMFYLVPALPFLAIGTVVAVARLGERTALRRPYSMAMITAGIGLLSVTVMQIAGLTTEGWRIRLMGLGAGWMLGAVAGALFDVRQGVTDGPYAPPPQDDPWAATTVSAPQSSSMDPADGATPAAQSELTSAVTVLDDTGAPAPVEQQPVAPDWATPAAADGDHPDQDDAALADESLPRRTVHLLSALVFSVTAVFLWFAPVWLAIPLVRSAMNLRWWLPGWI